MMSPRIASGLRTKLGVLFIIAACLAVSMEAAPVRPATLSKEVNHSSPATASGRYYGKAHKDNLKWKDDSGKKRSEWVQAPPTDEILHRVFFAERNNGRFAELGAAEGVADSNTKFFEQDLGWSGVLVEPLPYHFKRLRRNRPDATAVKAAICEGDEAALIPDGLASKVLAYGELSKAQKKKAVNVQCVTVAQVLQEAHITQLDLLAIDVEGHELFALESTDFTAAKIGVVMIESSSPSCKSGKKGNKCDALLRKNGFCLAGRSSVNAFWVAADGPSHALCKDPFNSKTVRALFADAPSADYESADGTRTVEPTPVEAANKLQETPLVESSDRSEASAFETTPRPTSTPLVAEDGGSDNGIELAALLGEFREHADSILKELKERESRLANLVQEAKEIGERVLASTNDSTSSDSRALANLQAQIADEHALYNESVGILRSAVNVAVSEVPPEPSSTTTPVAAPAGESQAPPEMSPQPKRGAVQADSENTPSAEPTVAADATPVPQQSSATPLSTMAPASPQPSPTASPSP
uniref:Methyltransferase FkbM domain-containing protein n=1 Tax=Erythrolobus australicus TaxID=1077150 RepID=A0A7S1XIB2_9RHOD|mmetsp:Transcript_1974/g.5200  ORF Transcript_1974/g.5200 Transcript_1974/m.5200 type:complete len:530 (+) Transcript_1974:130-1719(+)